MKSLKTEPGRILLIGIGNSGRKDDGLGWKFTEMVQAWDLPFVDTEYRYQLQVEDVLLVCRYDSVIFADASQARLPHGFEMKPCLPAQHYFFSSHVQTPETILYLAKDLYNRTPEAWTLAIKGREWGLGTDLSAQAGVNLKKALSFIKKRFLKPLANPHEQRNSS